MKWKYLSSLFCHVRIQRTDKISSRICVNDGKRYQISPREQIIWWQKYWNLRNYYINCCKYAREDIHEITSKKYVFWKKILKNTTSLFLLPPTFYSSLSYFFKTLPRLIELYLKNDYCSGIKSVISFK